MSDDYVRDFVVRREVGHEMICKVCGCFSSAQVCWHCSMAPGVQALRAELLAEREQREHFESMYCGQRDALKAERGAHEKLKEKHALLWQQFEEMNEAANDN